MSFKEWLKSQGLIEMEIEMDKDFDTGQKKPQPQLARIANKVVASAGPDFFGSIKSAPSMGMAQKRMMGTVQQGFKHLSPNVQKQYPVGDIASAASNAMGFKDLMKGVVS